MRYNKVRGIMRAKQGSQIPKFWNGGYSPNLPQFNTNIPQAWDYNIKQYLNQDKSGSLVNPNPNMTGSTTPQPKAATTSGTKLNTNSLGNAIGQGSDLISGMFAADKDGYQGKYGHLQQMGDQAFDQASNAIMQINPLVGGIMKAGGLVSDLLTTYGGMGTDSMTKTDAILGSKLLSLTPVGMVNGFFGRRTQDFGINQQTLEQVGSSYGGSKNTILDADSKAKKKYGLLSSGSRRKANNLITEAKRQQNIMTDIANDARDMQAMSGNDLNYINYNFDINGGYDQRYMRAAKSGMKIQDRINFVKQKRVVNNIINLDTKEIEWEPVIDNIVEEFKEGGIIEKISDWEPIIDDIIDYWEPVIDDIEVYKEGGSIKEELETPEIEETNQKNLIPEGALHKNKHHMEHTEGLTK